MHFTRDPIIETVITPREGCKLVVRSTKGAAQEDYQVEAVEVVSFGHSFFFRSLERPKSFLVPVSDYEVLEVKEAKMALKSASAERSIKIGGGRDIAPRPQKEPQEPREELQTPALAESRGDNRKRDRQRRRRRGRDRHDSFAPAAEGEVNPDRDASSEERHEDSLEGTPETPKEKAPSFISKLFPPPSTLIKDTISRYKTVDSAPEDILTMNRETSEEMDSGYLPLPDPEDEE